MGRIFRNAGQVFAWLGLEGADSALVMNNFKHQVGIMHWVDCEIESYRIWMATQAFFDRPYWKRSWVLQELMPAKGEITVFCGADTLSYKYIHSLHREMYKKMQNGQEYRYEDCECTGPNGRLRYCRRDLILEAAAAVCGRTLPLVMTKHNEHRGRPDTLRDLLYKYRDTKCEDPRDKVFSIMSLQSDLPPCFISTILNYQIDVHLLYIMLLVIYTQGYRLFPKAAESYFRYGHIDSESALTTFGIMLMESLTISSASVRQFLCQSPQIADPLFKRLVEFEYLNKEGLDGSVGIASLERIESTNGQDYQMFNVISPSYAFRPFMGGIRANLQLGDRIYRAQHSEVGIAFRRMQEYHEAVAWVIVGEGQDWTPDKSAWTRLEVLRGGRLPEPIDFPNPATRDFLGTALEIHIAADWHVAMSIVEGVSEMSWDLREPWKRSPPVSTSDSGAASPCDDAVSDVDAESSLTRISRYECWLYRDVKRNIAYCYCAARGMQQSKGDELEYLFKEASGTQPFTCPDWRGDHQDAPDYGRFYEHESLEARDLLLKYHESSQQRSVQSMAMK